MDTNDKWIEWVNGSGDKFGVHVDDFKNNPNSFPDVWKWSGQEKTYRFFRRMTSISEKELARQLFAARGVL